MAGKTIDDYIEGLGGDWRAEAVGRLRSVVDAAAPGATSTIKWAQPVWESNGPFAYVKAFPASVNIGFWRGADLDDPDGLLEGDGDRMKHVKLRSTDAIREEAIAGFVRQAIELNGRLGNPTRRG